MEKNCYAEHERMVLTDRLKGSVKMKRIELSPELKKQIKRVVVMFLVVVLLYGAIPQRKAVDITFPGMAMNVQGYLNLGNVQVRLQGTGTRLFYRIRRFEGTLTITPNGSYAPEQEYAVSYQSGRAILPGARLYLRNTQMILIDFDDGLARDRSKYAYISAPATTQEEARRVWQELIPMYLGGVRMPF